MLNNKPAQRAKDQKTKGLAEALKALPGANWQWAESDFSSNELLANCTDFAYWACDTPLGNLTCSLEGAKWVMALDRHNWGTLSPIRMKSAFQAEALRMHKLLGDI